MFKKFQKREKQVDLPNLTLFYLLKELAPALENSFINKVQELENNWLKLKLRTNDGSKNLLISSNAFFFSDYRLDAKQETSGYGAFLRKRISGKKILKAEQHELERLMEFTIGEYLLVIELFAKGNVLLLDSNQHILMPFRKEEWASRKLKKGEKYSIPPALGINPLKLTEKELLEFLSKTEEDNLVHALIKNIALAPIFLEEVCLNAGIDKKIPANTVTQAQAKKLLKEIKSLFKKTPSPVLVLLKEKQSLLPFPLNCCKENVLREFSSINTAIDELSSGKLLEKDTFKESKQLKELEISLERQKNALKLNEEKIQSNKEKAEAIYSNYTQITAMISALEECKKEKMNEKEIMYKMKKSFPVIKNIDLKKRILSIELK